MILFQLFTKTGQSFVTHFEGVSCKMRHTGGQGGGRFECHEGGGQGSGARGQGPGAGNSIGVGWHPAATTAADAAPNGEAVA